jgi:hypothetical protein
VRNDRREHSEVRGSRTAASSQRSLIRRSNHAVENEPTAAEGGSIHHPSPTEAAPLKRTVDWFRVSRRFYRTALRQGSRNGTLLNARRSTVMFGLAPINTRTQEYSECLHR